MTTPWTPTTNEWVLLTRPARGHHGRPVTDAVQVVIPAGSDGMVLVRFVGTADTATVPAAQLSQHPLPTKRGI